MRSVIKAESIIGCLDAGVNSGQLHSPDCCGHQSRFDARGMNVSGRERRLIKNVRHLMPHMHICSVMD